MIINNQDKLFINKIKELIHPGSSVRLCVNSFSFNALFNLFGALEQCKEVKILVQTGEPERNFIYRESEAETALELQSYYRLEQVKELIRSKIEIHAGVTGSNSFLIIDDKVFQFAPHHFDEPTLGVLKDGKVYMILEVDGSAEAFGKIFNQLWANSSDFKSRLLSVYQYGNPMGSPDTLYHLTVSKIFENKTSEDIQEDRLTRTGFKNSVVWNLLYNFQKDAVLGAIDKIEKYNGCIIADSVGLGKTFEALAIIKYYELRNDRVLVLAPKKLRDNWITYRLNDKRNILVDDRLNFDVLNHTDLSRERGFSGEINLETINWGNYDLLVIDESHNFRNNNPSKGKITRYEKLMHEVIQSGVKTKVLMLSATPVNTRLNDLKNQLYFITESNDHALADRGIESIDYTLKHAQTKFNAWLKEDEPTRESLIDRLDGDYFKLLDIFTISRSRKHIEKYYDVADIGTFPTRLKPMSVYSDFDAQNPDFSITHLNDYLEGLNLKFYSPMYFVYPHKKPAYEALYDTETKSGHVFSQLDREESIITLMRINLLKRLESSMYAFQNTVSKLLESIENSLDKINTDVDLSTDIQLHDFDFDDEQFSDLVIGGKVKVLIQDLDRIKFEQFLQADREILLKLKKEIDKINSERDQKRIDLFNIIEDKIANPLNPDNKKVIVFSAYADTVKYLYEEASGFFLKKYNIKSALVTGSDSNKTNLKGCRPDLSNILINFSPLSKSRTTVFPDADEEIDLLFCTDCISEGQNLQDCDYLVNYDIHWNPVRIIQRFGRIDRIGSKNSQIQLVNFYPNVELDQYIDLVQRVKGRMQILDISATGDDNVIDERDGQNKELEYRKKQLKKMKESVMDLEDLEGGISISDLTFNDFKVDADRITDLSEFEGLASGAFSLVKNNTEDAVEGVLFCLKDIDPGHMEEKLKSNLLHPYSLVYVAADGGIKTPVRMGKKSLDLLKKLSYGQSHIDEEALKAFNLKTKSGKHMNRYVDLLDIVKNHLSGEEKEVVLQSIFNPDGSAISKQGQTGDYEIISYLIVG